ncbi:hypothetical protein SS50377_21143 [Spironucleus salmonicida]|uniref:Uncharacterized protein n=1 Tax=Spironucleus salmonicida TaxID=348837 RepID=V6LH86_9EUKA|nr:hypothetical protein SS50377_21143 [Spironucleus salmonicida]|eukprot:EST43925.1 Hypothetical protein SS50377_16227 [Spironucleus salmonicida]
MSTIAQPKQPGTVQTVRQTISDYFSYQKFYIYPENYDILKENDFQLPIFQLIKMPFLSYIAPSIDVVQQAFKTTPHIASIGDYLSFNSAKLYDPETFDLIPFSVAFGPFPKRFKSYQLARIIETNAKMHVVHSVVVEKSQNQLLFVVFQSTGKAQRVSQLKKILPVAEVNTTAYQELSVEIRKILKSDKPVTSQISCAAWGKINAYDVDQVFIDQVLSKIRKQK